MVDLVLAVVWVAAAQVAAALSYGEAAAGQNDWHAAAAAVLGFLRQK